MYLACVTFYYLFWLHASFWLLSPPVLHIIYMFTSRWELDKEGEALLLIISLYIKINSLMNLDIMDLLERVRDMRQFSLLVVFKWIEVDTTSIEILWKWVLWVLFRAGTDID